MAPEQTTVEVLAAIAEIKDILNRHIAEDATAMAKVNRALDLLEDADERIRDEVKEIRKLARSAIQAAQRAADASFENKALFEKFKTEFTMQLEKHTAELLRLISTDSAHDQRMRTFEKATQEAASKAMTQISNSAQKAGDSLQRRVVIPAGAVQALIMVLWWIAQHFFKH